MSLEGRNYGWFRDWGPYIIETTISDETHKILLSAAKKIRKSKKLMKENDYRYRLAGNLKEEYNYNNALTKKQDKIVTDELTWLASNYTKMSKTILKDDSNIREPDHITMLRPIWVNFMKSGEWNPSHTHTGDISCVAYLQVPPEIEEENKSADHTKHSNTPSAGRIEFRYGEDVGYSRNGVIKQPKEKTIFFFPCRLAHMVYPFKSKVERISISVNFSDKLNAKRNLGIK